MSLLLTTSAIAMAVMMVSTAWGGAVPKATGSATIERSPGGATFTVELVAFDYGASGDRGMFTYTDDNGYYVLKVASTRILAESMMAIFTGPVVEGNYPGIGIGTWVVIMVLDGGEPAYGADGCMGWLQSGETAALNDVATLTDSPYGWLYAIEGNIQVHV